MFENVERIPVPSDRRDAIEKILDANPDYKISDIVMLPLPSRTPILEVINGYYNDAGAPPRKEANLARPDMFRFRTVDGKPLLGVKVGLRPNLTTRQIRDLRKRGGSEVITRDYPAEFEVGAEMAVQLLLQYGYGMIHPRYFNRHARIERKEPELAADGSAVKPIDRWRIVEVGSGFEELARKNGDLQPIQKEDTHGSTGKRRN